jgi:ATP-dependent exoDNAse (exonuclease V) beta subunit
LQKKFKKVIKKWELAFNNNLNKEKLKNVVGKLNDELLNIEDIIILEKFKYPSIDDEEYFEAIYKPIEIFTSAQNMITEDESYNEYLRIAYIACSRAINKLYIHLRGDEQSVIFSHN